VDLKAGTIRISRRERMRRTRLPSVVLIPDELKPILEVWIPLAASIFVFPGNWRMGPWGTHGTGRCADTALREACDAAGVPRMSFDALRRFFNANARPAIRGLEMGTPPQGELPDGPQPPLPNNAHRTRPSGPPRRVIRTRQDSATYAENPVPAIKLAARRSIRIRGEAMGTLTPAQHRALKILRSMWPDGLNKEAMTEKYGSESWRQVLMRLRKDATFRSAIGFPEKGHRGLKSDLYRILPW
jgi:hypothetical protein